MNTKLASLSKRTSSSNVPSTPRPFVPNSDIGPFKVTLVSEAAKDERQQGGASQLPAAGLLRPPPLTLNLSVSAEAVYVCTDVNADRLIVKAVPRSAISLIDVEDVSSGEWEDVQGWFKQRAVYALACLALVATGSLFAWCAWPSWLSVLGLLVLPLLWPPLLWPMVVRFVPLRRPKGYMPLAERRSKVTIVAGQAPPLAFTISDEDWAALAGFLHDPHGRQRMGRISEMV